MVFSSFPFLWIFLPIALIGSVLTQKKGSNVFLLVMSLLFYAWGEPKYIVLLLLTISLNYCCGLLISRFKSGRKKSLIAGTAIIINLLFLGYFKYFNFFAESLNGLFQSEFIPLRKIALPIGISFYTFQAISYIADLSRGSIEVQRSWVDLALYISFFPQLVAGPIVKYKDISTSLHNRLLSLDKTIFGLKRFCFGLAKKVLLANTLGYTVDEILSHPIDELSGLLCWTAAVFYTLQIYFDFSGYSDMAIGLANVFGFNFRENFDLPYISTSIREFWRRWHISLSTWFRDYLYIPLGGNRKGTARTVINLLIVFFTTGLWHGAQWNFVAWGLFHGVFLILERFLPVKSNNKRFVSLLKHFYTMFIVCIGWVLFRADSLSMAADQLKQMFLPKGSGSWSFFEIVDPITLIIFIISLLLSAGIGKSFVRKIQEKQPALSEVLSETAAIFCLFLSIVMLANAAHNPFIYFRF